LHFAATQTRGGCITRLQEGIDIRRSGVFDRPQFGEVKSLVKLLKQGRSPTYKMVAFVANDEPS